MITVIMERTIIVDAFVPREGQPSHNLSSYSYERVIHCNWHDLACGAVNNHFALAF